jgi:hypothetical protein
MMYTYRVLQGFASVGAEGARHYKPGDIIQKPRLAKPSAFVELVQEPEQKAPEPLPEPPRRGRPTKARE